MHLNVMISRDFVREFPVPITYDLGQSGGEGIRDRVSNGS